MDFLKADSLPWLAGAQRQLRDARAAGRMPHSLLVLSMPGLGAEALAAWAGAFMLCQAPAMQPCGVCGACQLLKANNHPDWHRIGLEEDAQQLKIEQVRELIEALILKSYRGGAKVGVIEDAEALNTSSANAFLKTLEEPTPDTLLIMIARPSHRLPATVASRCTRIGLRAPARDEALRWLEAQAPGRGNWTAALDLAAGAPLRTLQLDAVQVAALDTDMRASLAELAAGRLDVTLLAERWLRSNPHLRIAWLENWITRLVHAGLGGGTWTQTAEPARLPAGLLKPKIGPLFELLDAVRDFKGLMRTGANQQLALEALLISGRTALAS